MSEPTTCTWREDRDGEWWPDCPRGPLTAYSPKAHHHQCPYCGQPITEIGFDEEGEESE